MLQSSWSLPLLLRSLPSWPKDLSPTHQRGRFGNDSPLPKEPLCQDPRTNIEQSPAIVDPQTRQILEFKIHGPKLNWLTTVAGKATFNNGQIDDEPHCVIAFPNPRDTEEPGQRFVVDMTRMQYGEAGRGLYSENYFLGTFSEFKESMKKICDETKDSGMIHPKFSNSGNDNELRLKACATKVWERWQNREIEGWCAFCGKPGSKFMRCGACKEKKVFYCCTEHQKSDWKLHKHTCQKNKN
jgi:hypothetical protein